MSIPGFDSAQHAYDNAEPDNADVCEGCADNDCDKCDVYDGICCNDCVHGEPEDPYFDSED